MKPTTCLMVVLYAVTVLGSSANAQTLTKTKALTNAPPPDFILPPPPVVLSKPVTSTTALRTTTRTQSSQMMSSESGPPSPGDGGGSGGSGGGDTPFTPLLVLFTNGPATLLFDTLGSGSNGLLPSWRDWRTAPGNDGTMVGVVIATNCPFELTTVSWEVVLQNPENLAATEFECGFYRNTNDLLTGLYQDPEFMVSDTEGTLNKTLTQLANGNWQLSVDLPEYAWGTNRVLMVRTEPSGNGNHTKLNLVASADVVPGVTAYAVDGTGTNLVPVAVPKMQVWRRVIAPTRTPVFDASIWSQWYVTLLPGYQLGSATDLTQPFDWQTDNRRVWHTIWDTSANQKFMVARPDPTE